MKYIGTVYGKVRGKYFPLTMTSEQVDEVINQRDEALAALEAVLADNQSGYERHGLGADTIERVRSTIARLKS